VSGKQHHITRSAGVQITCCRIGDDLMFGSGLKSIEARAALLKEARSLQP
jgi:hypothetical protein